MLVNPVKIIKIINDIRYHQNLLKRWGIEDNKLKIAGWILEKIYIKYYFNYHSGQIMEKFNNIRRPNHYYKVNNRRVSYAIGDIFNEV